MRKKSFFILALVFITISFALFCPVRSYFSFLIPSHLWLPSPFKIVNPDSPHFNPMAFKFEDYRTKNHAEDTLNKIFPLGTSKETIDALFINQMYLEERFIGNKNDRYSRVYFEILKDRNSERWVRVLYSQEGISLSDIKLFYHKKSGPLTKEIGEPVGVPKYTPATITHVKVED